MPTPLRNALDGASRGLSDVPPSRVTPASRQDADFITQSLRRGLFAHQNGDLVEAARLYKLVLRRHPAHPDALHLLGMAEGQRGRWDKAERLIRDALAHNDQNAEIWSNLGNVQHHRGDYEAALASFERAVAIAPGHALALNNRGNTLLAMERAEDALASFDAALSANSSFPGALHNRGIALRALGRHAEALADFDKALGLAPAAAQIHVDRGSALFELGRHDEAQAALERAIALDPRSAEAHYALGVVLLHKLRFDAALESFDRTLEIDSCHAGAHSNRGAALAELGRIDEALASFDKALHQDPNLLVALSGKGQAAITAGQYQIAAESFERLVARNGEYPYALGNLLYMRAYVCDWQNFDVLRSLVDEGVRDGRPTIMPGNLLATTNSPAEQLQATRTWVNDIYPATAARPTRGYKHDRVRLAYLSGNFNEHAVGLLVAGLIERHDRSRFEVTAISYGPDDRSELRGRLIAGFDRFIDVSAKSDEYAATAMEDLEIDIAVDLMGHTQGFRPGILLRRPAPVQATWLGYPGTTGLDAVDYIIADRNVIPENERGHYSEKVVYLPDTYFHYDDRRPIADQTPSRAEAGLPESGFVFCCFNNNYKILPEVFGIWMRLLQQVEGSVLWLLRPNAAAERNLRSAAASHGVDPERLVFAPRVPPAEHLARHRLADVFLDTWPYNAHTTSCDALWTGLPVVTCVGSTFPARVAASQLSALGLPELITQSAEDYAALALKLAQDPQLLTATKDKISRQRQSHPLFNTDLSRRHVEAAYIAMLARHARGQPPESFSVASLSPAPRA